LGKNVQVDSGSLGFRNATYNSSLPQPSKPKGTGHFGQRLLGKIHVIGYHRVVLMAAQHQP
jgi:hypothetical protein